MRHARLTRALSLALAALGTVAAAADADRARDVKVTVLSPYWMPGTPSSILRSAGYTARRAAVIGVFTFIDFALPARRFSTAVFAFAL